MAKAKSLAKRHSLVRRLLKTFEGRAVTPAKVTERIGSLGLPAGWADREMVGFVNDAETVVFEIPLAGLTGTKGLHFSQEVWMLQPSAFEYVTLGDVAIVRLWWDSHSGATGIPRS